MRKPAEELTLQDVSLVLIDFGVRFRPSQAARFKSHAPIDIRKAIKKILVDNRSVHKEKGIQCWKRRRLQALDNRRGRNLF